MKNPIRRRALSVLLAFSMIFSVFQFAGIPAFAEEVPSVTAYYCDSGLFKDSQFTQEVSSKSTITNIEIKEGTKAIGVEAFMGCDALTDIVIPNSITSIGESAFIGCIALTDIVIPNSVTFMDVGAFSYCDNLTNINFAEGSKLAAIGARAFSNCKKVTEISIPASVTTIGVGAFSYCDYLTNIDFAEGSKLTAIEAKAFSSCPRLQGIAIPSGVTSIGDEVFYYCIALTAVTVDESNSKYCSEDGILFTKDKTRLLAYPAGKGGITYAIPDCVTEIGSFAFSDCANLTDISVPAGVTAIGEGAFFNCENLLNANFNDESKLTSIGDFAFTNCNLTRIFIPGGVTAIGKVAFASCSGLTSIIIPSGVKTLGDQAFEGCSNLTGAVFESATPPATVGSDVFKNCSNGLTIWVPTVTAVGSYQTNFSGYSISAPMEPVDDSIFSDGGLYFRVTSAESKTLEITSPDETCGGEISIPEKVAYLGNIFSVTAIGEFAFANCTGMMGITIPATVTTIGKGAFIDCDGLADITIPASVTTIGEGAFAGCTGLTEITAAEGSESFYTDENGILFTKDKTKLIAYPAGKTATEYSIPANVTQIADNAFAGCFSLTDISIPNSVTSVGMGAFFNCASLESIVLPNSVASIGMSAFADCFELTSITISNSVTSISENAFGGCTSLTNIQIPDSVTSIGENAFGDCTGLTGITIPNSVTSISNYTFYGCTGLTSITIPNSVTSIGESAFGDCTGLTGITIPNSVTSISDYTFYGCTGLTSITIPNSVTSIGESAFDSCTGLTGIAIPNSVTSIGDYTFYGCTGLTDITIPNSVTSIGGGAFESCAGLKNVILRGASASINANTFNEGENISITFYVPAVCSDQYKTALNQDVMGETTADVVGVKFVSSISLPKEKEVANGTKIEDLQLPGTLTLTVNNGNGQDKTETLNNITWTSSPDYSPDEAGTYTFTPVLPNGYLPDSDASIKVTVKGKRTEKAIISFKIGDIPGLINEAGHTIAVTVPNGTDVAALSPEITVSDSASVAPASGTAQNFTNSVAYTVTAENGGTQIYTVTVTVKKSDSGSSSSSTPASVSIPVEITNSAAGASVNLSGATMPTGVTGVTLSATHPAQGGAPDAQASNALHLAVTDAKLNVIGTPVVYDLKLLDQNGSLLTGFSGRVTVRLPLPAGLRGTPHVLRYEETTGTFTDMNATVENGYLVFSTDHFSYYAIAGVGDSITLDTKNYRMPANGSYQIGVKLTGTKAASVKFYSSNNKIATVTKLKNGNYRVNGKGTGTAYIMFDVYDNKNRLLTHASVRIDVKAGSRPGGDSARQIGVF